MSFQAICAEQIQIIDGSPACVSGWVVAQVPEVFDISMYDISNGVHFFGFGFLLYLSWWVVMHPVSWLLQSFFDFMKSYK